MFSSRNIQAVFPPSSIRDTAVISSQPHPERRSFVPGNNLPTHLTTSTILTKPSTRIPSIHMIEQYSGDYSNKLVK